MKNNTQREFTLFPYDINPFDVTTFQIQIFNNEDNFNVRMDIHSIDHKFGHYNKYKLQLSKDKTNLQSALKTLRRNYSHIEGIEEYIQKIENECPINATYSHCRSAERGCNTSYKFCDAVYWNTDEGITLKVFIYEKTFTYPIPHALLDENKLMKGSKGKSAVNNSIKNYDLYDDDFVINDIEQMKSISKPSKPTKKATKSPNLTQTPSITRLDDSIAQEVKELKSLYSDKDIEALKRFINKMYSVDCWNYGPPEHSNKTITMHEMLDHSHQSGSPLWQSAFEIGLLKLSNLLNCNVSDKAILEVQSNIRSLEKSYEEHLQSQQPDEDEVVFSESY